VIFVFSTSGFGDEDEGHFGSQKWETIEVGQNSPDIYVVYSDFLAIIFDYHEFLMLNSRFDIVPPRYLCKRKVADSWDVFH
jgi:hypothetical protein